MYILNSNALQPLSSLKGHCRGRNPKRSHHAPHLCPPDPTATSHFPNWWWKRLKVCECGALYCFCGRTSEVKAFDRFYKNQKVHPSQLESPSDQLTGDDSNRCISEEDAILKGVGPCSKPYIPLFFIFDGIAKREFGTGSLGISLLLDRPKYKQSLVRSHTVFLCPHSLAC